MLFRHSMSITQQLMPIYNTTMHKNKINVALNLKWLTVGCYEASNRPQGRMSCNSYGSKLFMYGIQRVTVTGEFNMYFQCTNLIHSVLNMQIYNQSIDPNECKSLSNLLNTPFLPEICHHITCVCVSIVPNLV